jgi:hypothetical protein
MENLINNKCKKFEFDFSYPRACGDINEAMKEEKISFDNHKITQGNNKEFNITKKYLEKYDCLKPVKETYLEYFQKICCGYLPSERNLLDVWETEVIDNDSDSDNYNTITTIDFIVNGDVHTITNLEIIRYFIDNFRLPKRYSNFYYSYNPDSSDWNFTIIIHTNKNIYIANKYPLTSKELTFKVSENKD